MVVTEKYQTKGFEKKTLGLKDKIKGKARRNCVHIAEKYPLDIGFQNTQMDK